jgi:hypothetical protein
MTYTVQEAIEDTQRHLNSAERPELNLLASGIDDSTTSVPFTLAAGGITTRAVLCIGTEMMYVTSVSGTTATVIRGYNSEATAHTANDIIEVNARFPQAMIARALRDEIRSWPQELFKVTTVEYAVSSSEAGIDLTGFSTGINYLLDVLISPPTGDLTKAWQRVPRWTFRKQADPGDFTSTYSLTIVRTADFDPRVYANTTRDYRVVAATPFVTSTFTTATDLEATVGLAPSMLDIPPLGAAARLLVGKEVIRTAIEVQGQPRRADEVPAGHAIQTSQAIMQMRNRRISEEAMRLRADWPYRGV